jgi:SAM-dependent methyltransferase
VAAAAQRPAIPSSQAASATKRMKITYSENRRRADKAASYDVKYERELHKRLSNWKEKRLIASLLADTGRLERMLDVPCGAGRLSGVLARHAEKVFEVDYSREMLKVCRRNASGYESRFAEASAFDLPFGDGTFDMVVSIRLSHHIPDRAARLAHLRELFRSSRRYVLATFFDENTLKNRLRTLHRKVGRGKRPKHTLTMDEVSRVAEESGFRVLRSRRLSSLFSGHCFTLFTKA